MEVSKRPVCAPDNGALADEDFSCPKCGGHGYGYGRINNPRAGYGPGWCTILVAYYCYYCGKLFLDPVAFVNEPKKFVGPYQE